MEMSRGRRGKWERTYAVICDGEEVLLGEVCFSLDVSLRSQVVLCKETSGLTMRLDHMVSTFFGCHKRLITDVSWQKAFELIVTTRKFSRVLRSTTTTVLTIFPPDSCLINADES